MVGNVVFGKSQSGHYAVTLDGDAVWEQVEAVGELYRPIGYDEIPEDDWDRIGQLEQRLEVAE
jgi:hypothetical protein